VVVVTIAFAAVAGRRPSVRRRAGRTIGCRPLPGLIATSLALRRPRRKRQCLTIHDSGAQQLAPAATSLVAPVRALHAQLAPL